MPSSFEARSHHPSRFPLKKIEATGKFQFAIMALASRKSTPIVSSSSSSGCIQRPNIQAQASGWPSARRLSSGMAVESGSSRQLVEVLRFVSRFPLNQSGVSRRKNKMNFESPSIPVDILLVEDNAGDVRLTQEVLRDSKVRNNLIVASNGEEALACLRKQGKFKNTIRPDLILLDLNLPIKDGRQVLAEIKDDIDLKRIPVVILTTSKAEEDILRTYNLHANCYVTKPVDLEQFVKVVKSLEDFWLAIVKLPNHKQ